MSIRIYLLDGSFKTLTVDSFTLACDVQDMVVRKLGLTFAAPFALYEVAEGRIRSIPYPLHWARD